MPKPGLRSTNTSRRTQTTWRDGLKNRVKVDESLDAAFLKINQQIAQNPNQPRLYVSLGQLYYSRRDYVRAEQAYRKALSLDSNNLSVYSMLGQLFMAQNSIDKAIRELENALKIDPKSVSSWIVLGFIYESQKNSQKAIQCYREALKVDPEMPIAANNLAWQLAETGGNLDEALTLARMAREKLANTDYSANTADTLGWVFYKRRAYQSAIDLFTECVEKNPTNDVYRQHLKLAKDAPR
jgi:Tfp pilus assembly protein PilF